jgi:hypothetical protein
MTKTNTAPNPSNGKLSSFISPTDEAVSKLNALSKSDIDAARQQASAGSDKIDEAKKNKYKANFSGQEGVIQLRDNMLKAEKHALAGYYSIKTIDRESSVNTQAKEILSQLLVSNKDFVANEVRELNYKIEDKEEFIKEYLDLIDKCQKEIHFVGPENNESRLKRSEKIIELEDQLSRIASRIPTIEKLAAIYLVTKGLNLDLNNIDTKKFNQSATALLGVIEQKQNKNLKLINDGKLETVEINGIKLQTFPGLGTNLLNAVDEYNKRNSEYIAQRDKHFRNEAIDYVPSASQQSGKARTESGYDFNKVTFENMIGAGSTYEIPKGVEEIKWAGSENNEVVPYTVSSGKKVFKLNNPSELLMEACEVDEKTGKPTMNKVNLKVSNGQSIYIARIGNQDYDGNPETLRNTLKTLLNSNNDWIMLRIVVPNSSSNGGTANAGKNVAIKITDINKFLNAVAKN